MINKPVVFFDGVCGLCNSTVDVLLKIDRKKTILFAPLQGTLGQEVLKQLGVPGDAFTSILFMEEGKIYSRSTAIIRISRHLGGIWSLGMIALIIPKFIRDGLYNFIARNRYRWFGKHETCRLPSPAERARFLD